MNIRETELGFEIESPAAFVFFGKKTSSLSALQATYQDFFWARIKQVHSDIVVPSPDPRLENIPEADAHWTEAPGLGLLIATADCVPALMIDPTQGRAIAIHAGWRGVASRIIPKAINALRVAGSDPRQCHVFIGPHIQKPSFEVSQDAYDDLVKSCDQDPNLISEPRAQGKFLVDLSSIVHSQFLENRIPKEQILSLPMDTKTDERFHSHRRDREKAGRQLSFIALKAKP